MLVAMLMVLAVLTVRDRFSDPDMWWHLRTGQVIWTTHTIPHTDLFSWTTNHHAWVPHEWLSQVFIYGAWRLGGYSGLMLFLCIATGAVLLCSYLLCTLYSGNAKVALIGALVVWFFATSGMAIRPQMIGYLLLVLELIVIHCGSTRSSRWFYCLPPLFAVWVNCHGSFLLGLVIAACLLACSFVKLHVGLLETAPWTQSAQRACALALLLSVPALFLNPVGWHQVAYPLQTMLHMPANLSQVMEWQPLVLTSARGLGLLVVLAGIGACVLCMRTRLMLHELVLLGIGTWLALSHQRMAFVFGILAAPMLTRLLAPFWQERENAREHYIANAVLIALSLLLIWFVFPSRTGLAKQIADHNPTRAVDFINTHALSGHMLNDWGFGGYLIWAAPDHPVFIDGRGDVFEWTGVMNDFGNWALIQSDPRTLLDKYRVDYCLLARDSPMSHVMPLLPGWRTVYSDDQAIVFVHDRGR